MEEWLKEDDEDEEVSSKTLPTFTFDEGNRREQEEGEEVL